MPKEKKTKPGANALPLMKSGSEIILIAVKLCDIIIHADRVRN